MEGKNLMRKTAEFLAAVALAALFFVTWSALAGPNRLPDRVPTHFDAAGTPNAWGSPGAIILLPVIACAVYLLITVVAFFPQSFNYPVRVTPLNRARLQQITLSMVTWIKAEIVALFATLQWVYVQAARTNDGSLFPRVLPVSLVVIFGTLAIAFAALFRAAASRPPAPNDPIEPE